MNFRTIAFCSLLTFSITSAIFPADTQQVTAQKGEVPKDGIIESTTQDLSLPEKTMKIGSGKIRILSKTFIPPPNFLFKSYGNSFVDILMDPDGMTEAKPDTATAIAVNGIYIQNTAVDFPLQAEGNLVPATGGSGGSGEPPLFHWAAKVPKVRLVVKNGAVVINPPNPNKDIANITAVPAMPALTAHLEPLGLPGEVTWTFHVTYNRHLRADNDTYPRAGARMLAYNTPWDIIPDMSGDFRGGDATVTAVYMGQTLTLDFLIHGLNPTPADARTYIMGQPSAPPYAKAIIDHEAMFRQFNEPNGATNPGEPNFSVDPAPNQTHGGWGMAQLDDETMAIQANWLWNWHQNVDEAIVIMVAKLDTATGFYNKQVAQQMASAPKLTIDTVHLNYGGIAFLTTTPPHIPVNPLGIQYYNGTAPGGVSHSLFSWLEKPMPHWMVYGSPWRDYTDTVCGLWAGADQ